MDKKGMSGILVKLIVALMILTVLVFWASDLPAKTLDALNGIGNSILGAGEVRCDTTHSPDENEQLIKEHAAETSEPAIPGNLAVAVAMQESSLRHCSDGIITGSDVSGDKRSIGLMQVNEDTADICVGMDIYDRGENVECGLMILKDKYNKYLDDEDYQDAVEDFCDPNDNPNKFDSYMEYRGNDWKKALRAYNGLGCNEGADLEYVENVAEKCENCGFLS